MSAGFCFLLFLLLILDVTSEIGKLSCFAGRFDCEQCPGIQTAVTRYCVLIAGIIAINAFLIWRLLAVGNAEWVEPEGQDYVEVLLLKPFPYTTRPSKKHWLVWPVLWLMPWW